MQRIQPRKYNSMMCVLRACVTLTRTACAARYLTMCVYTVGMVHWLQTPELFPLYLISQSNLSKSLGGCVAVDFKYLISQLDWVTWEEWKGSDKVVLAMTIMWSTRLSTGLLLWARYSKVYKYRWASTDLTTTSESILTANIYVLKYINSLGLSDAYICQWINHHCFR